MAIAGILQPVPADTRLTTESFPLTNRSIHLSVEVREKEIVACLLDKQQNRYIAWAIYPLNEKQHPLNSILKEDLFTASAASVSVVFTANSYILLPAQFFKKEHLQDYLKFQQLYKPTDVACYDYIKNLDSYNVYTVSSNIYNTLKESFPGASFRHHASVFMEFVLIENKNIHEDKVYVTVFHNYFDALVLQAGKLILANRFYYENNSDFMFHLLWVYEQLHLDSEKVPCLFFGDIENEKYSLAFKYIKKVHTGNRNDQSGYAAALDKLPAYKYRSLFTQYLCV